MTNLTALLRCERPMEPALVSPDRFTQADAAVQQTLLNALFDAVQDWKPGPPYNGFIQAAVVMEGEEGRTYMVAIPKPLMRLVPWLPVVVNDMPVHYTILSQREYYA